MQGCAGARVVIAGSPVRLGSWRPLALLGLAVVTASGCTGTTGHLALASTRDLDLAAIEKPSGRRVKGRSCIHVVTVVPIGLPQVDEAIDEALAPVGGILMRDVTVTSAHSVYVLFGWHCYRVRGEVFG